MNRPAFKIFPKNPRHLLILLVVLLAVFAVDRLDRHWAQKLEINTTHFTIRSSASPEQTQKIGEMCEILHAAYSQTFTNLAPIGHSKLQIRLFKDRAEFRRVNRWVGWAEAFYREPYCNAYFSADETNPYHWMLHEATHQLNNEAAHFKLPKWENEGIATYLSTSIVTNGLLIPGQIDRNTYPIWWLDSMFLTGDIRKDIAANKIIPLHTIVTGHGGPDLNKNVNLYYLHWWSLSHFLFHYEGGKYRGGYLRVINSSGTLESFENNIGPIERVQGEWYAYLQEKAKGRL